MKYLVRFTDGRFFPCADLQTAELEARKHLMSNLATAGRNAMIFEAISEVTIDIVTKYRPIADFQNETDPVYFGMDNHLEPDTVYNVKIKDKRTPDLWYSGYPNKIYEVLWNGREFCHKEFPWKKIPHFDCIIIDGSEAQDAK